MSDPMDRLHKIQELWLSYNAVASELMYALSEGGDTDVTQNDVDHAWNVLNDWIMLNAGGHRQEEG